MPILSIDYGDKRIGLAISDKEKKLASRFLTVKNKSIKDSVLKISKIASDEKAEKIIIGLPIGLKSKSEQTQKTRNFINRLRKELSIPIIEINEVFTSKMAEKNLRDAGVKGKKLKDIIDQEAARIILQEYLDGLNKNLDGP